MAVFRFDWDENKNQTNLAKHEIDFLDAIEVFDDPFRTVNFSIRDGSHEIRFLVVSMTKNERHMAVVCTLRGEFVRIISARKARRNERREYHDRRTTSGWTSL